MKRRRFSLDEATAGRLLAAIEKGQAPAAEDLDVLAAALAAGARKRGQPKLKEKSIESLFMYRRNRGTAEQPLEIAAAVELCGGDIDKVATVYDLDTRRVKNYHSDFGKLFAGKRSTNMLEAMLVSLSARHAADRLAAYAAHKVYTPPVTIR